LAAGVLGGMLVVSAALYDEWQALHRVEVALRRRTGVRPDGLPRVSADEEAAPALSWTRWVRVQPDRAMSWVLIAVAAICLVAGIRSVANELLPPAQLSYLVSGGVGGLYLLALGAATLLSADLRDLDSKLDRLDHLLASRQPVNVRRIPGQAASTDGARQRAAVSQRTVSPRGWFLPPVAILVVAAGVIGLGWWRAADALAVERALDGLVIGVVGLGIAVAVLAIQGAGHRRAVVRGMSALDDELVAAHWVEIPRQGGAVDLWTAPGLHRYHRPSCPALLKAGSERRAVTPTESGLEPCLLCEAGE
jgi:hypothetical protein